MKFVVPEFPPYTYQSNGKIKGIAIESVTKVLTHANINYEIAITSDYGSAVKKVKNGEADGFFVASQNDERNEIAHFTKALLLNRWSWFLLSSNALHPKTPGFKQLAGIGTVLNTNTHKWLDKEEFRVTTAVLNVELLITMLNKKHVDAVFVAESVFIQGVKRGNKPLSHYQSITQKVKPMGIYISKNYVKKHPKTLDKINQSILYYFSDIN